LHNTLHAVRSTWYMWKDNIKEYLDKRAFWRFYRTDKPWPPTRSSEDKVGISSMSPPPPNILYLCHGRTHGMELHANQVDFARCETYLVDASLACKPDVQRDLTFPDALADVHTGSIDLVIFPFCHCHTDRILCNPGTASEIARILSPHGGRLLIDNCKTNLYSMVNGEITSTLDNLFVACAFEIGSNRAFLAKPETLLLPPRSALFRCRTTEEIEAKKQVKEEEKEKEEKKDVKEQVDDDDDDDAPYSPISEVDASRSPGYLLRHEQSAGHSPLVSLSPLAFTSDEDEDDSSFRKTS
jgi:hypothetical protein